MYIMYSKKDQTTIVIIRIFVLHIVPENINSKIFIIYVHI